MSCPTKWELWLLKLWALEWELQGIRKRLREAVVLC